MKEARAWLRLLPSAVICLSISPALSAAEASERPAPLRPARTAAPWCAKLLCQHRAVTADRGAGAEQAESASPASPVSLRFGLGVGMFRGPSEEVQLPYTRYPTSDGYVSIGPAESEHRREKIEGGALSLGVSMEQALASSSALRWGLQERLAFVAVLPLDGSSLLGGFGDVLVVARVRSWPVYLGLGPSLGVAQLDLKDDLFYVDDPAVIAGGAAAAGLDLGALPGSLELSAHFGKSLTYDSAFHSDLQLAFALPL